MNPSILIHYPWDDGACDSAFLEVFGVVPPQKTIKTKCGKRVLKSTTKDVSALVTCDVCLAEMDREKEANLRLLKSLRQFGAHA